MRIPKTPTLSPDYLAFAMAGPIICAPGTEGDYPIRCKEVMTIERLTQESYGVPITMAADVEVIGYLSTMSLISPLPSDFVDIYRYLFTRCARRHDWELPDDVKLDELDDWKRREYERLATWVRETSWNAYRKKAA